MVAAFGPLTCAPPPHPPQDALSSATSIIKAKHEVAGNEFYDYDIDSPVRREGGRACRPAACCCLLFTAVRTNLLSSPLLLDWHYQPV